MMSETEDKEKWACEYCTYENYVATKRCTLCRAPKRPQYITNDTAMPYPDIYQVASQLYDSGANSSALSLSTISSYDTTNKWICDMCTYINWPRATKCTQCLTPKQASPKSRRQQRKVQQHLQQYVQSRDVQQPLSPQKQSQQQQHQQQQNTRSNDKLSVSDCREQVVGHTDMANKIAMSTSDISPLISSATTNNDMVTSTILATAIATVTTSSLTSLSVAPPSVVASLSSNAILSQPASLNMSISPPPMPIQSSASVGRLDISGSNKFHIEQQQQQKDIDVKENSQTNNYAALSNTASNIPASSPSSQHVADTDGMTTSSGKPNTIPSPSQVPTRTIPKLVSHSKWRCKACTYQNWPKGQKCALCGTPRGKMYHEGNSAISIECSMPNDNMSSGSSSSGYYVSRNNDGDTTISNNFQLPGRLLSPVLVTSDNKETSSAVMGHATLQGAMALAGNGRGSSGSPSPESQPGGTFDDRSQLRLFQQHLSDSDWLWLNACRGVVEGDVGAVEAYLSVGGDPTRQLTKDEVSMLSRPSAFQVGYTLVHLAIRFQQEDMLATLLTLTDTVPSSGMKRLPAHISPNLAADIRREVTTSLRLRKGSFPCYYLTDCITFSLPADIDDLTGSVQTQLFDELLDRMVQNELEVEEHVINWSMEVTETLGSRLYALWNRTAGDCLLDSVLQATWAIFDTDNTLRRALADSLSEGAYMFYPRWKEYESTQAEILQFTLDECQWQRDWAVLLSLANQPGASLEQTHIFALAHILRRPIIVYGVKYVKSFRGETIGYAGFQGVYLPLLWDREFCWKTPIALGYTRGHFSALVPMEMDSTDLTGAGADIDHGEESQVAYLPLTDSQGQVLPVHFLTNSETGQEESLLREWLDCGLTKQGLLVAAQVLGKRPLCVKQMLDEWLDRYRQLTRVVQSSSAQVTSYSSDEETDDE